MSKYIVIAGLFVTSCFITYSLTSCDVNNAPRTSNSGTGGLTVY
jgi:hypothetical protein